MLDSPENKVTEKSNLQRPGIEPGPPAWQARILPLNQRCLSYGHKVLIYKTQLTRIALQFLGPEIRK